MARKPVRVAAKDKSTLLLAVEHAYLVGQSAAAYSGYCNFTPGWLVSYDGVVASGYRIVEEYAVGAHTETLRHALMRAGNPFSVTVSASSMIVRGNAVRVDVPTCLPASIPYCPPDAPLAAFDTILTNALLAVVKIVSARSDRVIAASVLLRSQSCVASNGNTIIESHHGHVIPGSFLLPREFIDALGKVKQQPTAFGYSNTTFTVWFGNDAWLRCNTYQEQYPDTDVFFAQMMAASSEYRNMPQDMLLAIETLKPFLDGTDVMVAPRGINTRRDFTGASYTFDHYLPADACRMVPYDALRMAAVYGDAIAFSENGFFWYGKQLRGITRA